MSMLGEQIKELWRMADELDEHSAFIGYGGSVSRDPYIRDAAVMLREAADTIESLSDKLQGVIGTRYCELFGTPERAARTLERKFASCNGNVCIAPNVDYDALLEWLRGDAE